MVDYLMIGEVLRPQGIQGECKIRPWAADLDLFRRWKTLYLQQGGAYEPVSCRVTRIHDGFVYAVLADCAGPEDAERYRNRKLYIDRAHAAKPEKGAVFIADLIGCEARTPDGTVLGRLSEVLQYGPVDTWVFKAPDGRAWMAPALMAVFPEVDPESRVIAVVPERLQEVAVYED